MFKKFTAFVLLGMLGTAFSCYGLNDSKLSIVVEQNYNESLECPPTPDLDNNAQWEAVECPPTPELGDNAQWKTLLGVFLSRRLFDAPPSPNLTFAPPSPTLTGMSALLS